MLGKRVLRWLRFWRGLQHWYADTHNYFWLPCPLCGEPHGGHEWRGYSPSSIPVPDEPGLSTGICYRPACVAEATRQHQDAATNGWPSESPDCRWQRRKCPECNASRWVKEAA